MSIRSARPKLVRPLVVCHELDNRTELKLTSSLIPSPPRLPAFAPSSLPHSKLPQNGLGARVAPIPWVLSGRPSCYYCVTGVSISYAPFVDRAGFPVKLVDGKKVPADQAYSKNQAEAAKQKAEEAMRAARAGEMVQDTNIREKLRVKEELDELLVETHNGIMRPLVKAWGIRYENGESRVGSGGGQKAGGRRTGKGREEGAQWVSSS